MYKSQVTVVVNTTGGKVHTFTGDNGAAVLSQLEAKETIDAADANGRVIIPFWSVDDACIKVERVSSDDPVDANCN